MPGYPTPAASPGLPAGPDRVSAGPRPTHVKGYSIYHLVAESPAASDGRVVGWATFGSWAAGRRQRASSASIDHFPGPAIIRKADVSSWAYSDRDSCRT